jgi:flagella basal body P-ring formation protein FlgA
MTPLAAFAITACLAVSPASDKVLARDLAPAFPALAALPPETALALAPLPGERRVFHAGELQRMALRLGVAAPEAGDVCVERKAAPLEIPAALAAMRKTLPEARIEIAELSRTPAPEGELSFPLTGLRQGPKDALWSGEVRYGGGRRFMVWARVRVSVTQTLVVAAASLRAGAAIAETDLKLETREVFPGRDAFAGAIAEVAGHVARRATAAGTPIDRRWLDPPRLVERGARVRVDARSGGAVLELDAIAEGDGAAGQIISVRNPISGNLFRAKVEGKDMVSVGSVGKESR